MKESELKNCPFCGDNDLVKAYGNNLRTWVECIRCNCVIHNVAFTPAKDIWNTRADPYKDKLIKTLKLLLEAKKFKETFGKTATYEELKKLAWEMAIAMED